MAPGASLQVSHLPSLKILGLSGNLNPKSSRHSQPGRAWRLRAPTGSGLLGLQEARSSEARDKLSGVGRPVPRGCWVSGFVGESEKTKSKAGAKARDKKLTFNLQPDPSPSLCFMEGRVRPLWDLDTNSALCRHNLRDSSRFDEGSSQGRGRNEVTSLEAANTIK